MTGPAEVMPGQPIILNVATIDNSSSVELSDFYFRAVLPYTAIRLDRIFTGTFNYSLRYSVMFRTNLNGNWRVAHDNLSSRTNNSLNMAGGALGLANNEHITEIMFSFGSVHEGFATEIAPRLEGTVHQGLRSGYEFFTRADAGGRIGDEWVISNAVWQTNVFAPGR